MLFLLISLFLLLDVFLILLTLLPRNLFILPLALSHYLWFILFSSVTLLLIVYPVSIISLWGLIHIIVLEMLGLVLFLTAVLAGGLPELMGLLLCFLETVLRLDMWIPSLLQWILLLFLFVLNSLVPLKLSILLLMLLLLLRLFLLFLLWLFLFLLLDSICLLHLWVHCLVMDNLWIHLL